MIALIIGVLLLVWPALLAASTRTATPQTIRQALAQMQAGETLELTSGLYPVQITSLPNGATLMPAPGAQVTIRPPDQGHDTCGVCIRGRRGITVRGFHFDLRASTNCGISVTGGSSQITITGNTLRHLPDPRQGPNGGGAICTSEGTHHNTITGNTITAFTAKSGLVHGIYVAGSETRIEGNTVTGSPGYGIHVYADSANRHAATAGNVIRNNRVQHNDRGIFAMGTGTQVLGNLFGGNRTLDLRWRRGDQVVTTQGSAGGPAPLPVPAPSPVVPAPTALRVRILP